MKGEYSIRFKIDNYNRSRRLPEYQLFRDWTSPGFPRVVVVELQHSNPFYDDSYAVNSANLGPYGDAIMYELIPTIEKQYRCLGKGWSRLMYGGSTGGWEALAVQIFYPDEFNGCFAACPDPVDFRAYTVVNIYEARERVLLRQQVEKDDPSRRREIISAKSSRRSRMRIILSLPSAPTAAPVSNGISGRPSSDQLGRMGTRNRSGIR